MKIRYSRTFEVEIDDATLVDCCKARGPDREFEQAGIGDILYELDSRGLLTDDGGEADLPELINDGDFEQDYYTPEELAEELSKPATG